MPHHGTRPLGICVQSDVALLIPHSPEPDAPLPSIGQRVTREDLATLPARIPQGPSTGLIPSHALDVRYKGLWHGFLASSDPSTIPEREGFHPGTTPAFPKPLLIHPDVHYLRRNALHFPYFRHEDQHYLLCLPYRKQTHIPFLIGIDGLIVPYVYVSAESPVKTTFPGDAGRFCDLRR